ncbi:MAG: RsmE family RNA methyltransferase [Patescibacteria group bacterium]|nr:16S rRNA (uracil(1498)-N(3))-methyltransferase [Patescibacteria group bacterium]
MKIHRFLIKADLTREEILITDTAVVDQTRKVLRLKIGERIGLFDGEGNEVLAEILAVEPRSINVRLVKSNFRKENNERIVALYCSILKKSNFELVVQKATEVGVSRIIPIVTKRTVKLNLKIERLAKIATEAAEQSGRRFVSEIKEITQFAEAVEYSSRKDINILFEENGDPLKFSDKQLSNREKHVGIWIGPEGGWADEEIVLARKFSFKIVSLGHFTMRAETAAIIAAYLSVQS